MNLNIDMAWDLTTGVNPKIIITSPSNRRYELTAEVSTYGNRSIVGGRSIPQMRLSVNIAGKVAYEEGEFKYQATIDMGNYKLESDVFKIKVEGGMASFLPPEEDEVKKIAEGTGSSITM